MGSEDIRVPCETMDLLIAPGEGTMGLPHSIMVRTPPRLMESFYPEIHLEKVRQFW